tara:strand:- start:14 stop:208 length:195 start_codon:yes stop_codon:yes gene_type:complete
MIKTGDLVRMRDTMYDSKLVGIVMGRHPKHATTGPIQIGIKWFGGSGKVDWEPASWLEVVSESK